MEGRAYSRSLVETMPISRSFSTTGRWWMLRVRITLKASDNGASGPIITKSRVMYSRTSMGVSPEP